MSKGTTQILYLTLGLALLWVVLSEFVGGKYITNALANLFPSMVKE